MTEHSMPVKKCAWCENALSGSQTEYFVREYGNKKQICVFCYTHLMLQRQGREPSAKNNFNQLIEQMKGEAANDSE